MDVFTELTSELAGYATAAAALAVAIVVARVPLKWIKGFGSRAS